MEKVVYSRKYFTKGVTQIMTGPAKASRVARVIRGLEDSRRDTTMPQMIHVKALPKATSSPASLMKVNPMEAMYWKRRLNGQMSMDNAQNVSRKIPVKNAIFCALVSLRQNFFTIRP